MSSVVTAREMLERVNPVIDETDGWTDLRFADITVDRLYLDGVPANAQVKSALTDAYIERTIEGASTLELVLFDEKKELLRSGIFSKSVVAAVDGLLFSLVRVSKQDDSLTVTFEDLAVAKMRKYKKPRRAYRDKVTRAEFAKSLVREVKGVQIDFYCPELHKRQPIKGQTSKKAQKQKAQRDRKPGFHAGTKLTVKGRPADSDQLAVMAAVMDAADSVKGATGRPLLALVASIIIECEFRNVQGSGADSISFGVIQNIPGRSAGINGTFTKAQALDIDYSVRSALLPPGPTSKGGLIKLARQNPSASIGELGSRAINGGGNPSYASEVNGRRVEAQAIIDAWGGGGLTGGATKRYAFARNKGENTWDCLLRLAEEVGWRRFMVGRRLFFMAEADLIRSAPISVLDEDSPGVDRVDFDFDTGQPVNEANVTGRAKRWQAPPGSVVSLRASLGPASGRWLVSTIRRSLFNEDATISLKRAAKELPEPAPEKITATSKVSGTPSASFAGQITTAGGAKGIVDQAAALAASINSANYVGSSWRPGDTVESGGPSDHADNNASRAARDIGHRGIDLLVGPPSRTLDEAVVAIGKCFGRDYGDGRQTIIDTFTWNGFRIQIIWRTPKYGGHMGHIHIGVRRA